MRTLVAALIISTSLSTGLSAFDRKEDLKAFKAAYSEYQEVAQGDDKTATLEAAALARSTGLKLFKPTNKNMIQLNINYAEALSLKNQHEAARKILNELLETFEQLPDKGGDQRITILIQKAATYNPVNTAGGKKALRLAIRQAEETWPAESLRMGALYLEAGGILINQMGDRSANNYLKKAEEILATHKDEARLALTRFYLGKYYMSLRKHRTAVEYLTESIEPFEEQAPDSRFTMINHAFLVEAYEKLGKSEEATKHCQAIGKTRPGIENRDMLPIYMAAASYPRSMAIAGKSGYAIVELTVDMQGFVRDPQIIETSRKGSDFGTSALEAVQKYRYAPRYVDGKPTATEGVRYRVTFKMEN